MYLVQLSKISNNKIAFQYIRKYKIDNIIWFWIDLIPLWAERIINRLRDE